MLLLKSIALVAIILALDLTPILFGVWTRRTFWRRAAEHVYQFIVLCIMIIGVYYFRLNVITVLLTLLIMGLLTLFSVKYLMRLTHG